MKLPFVRKKNDCCLDDETAQQMLDSIFAACKRERNAVPLEVLTSYSNYRKERYTLQKVLLILVMVLFILVPLLFFPPTLSLSAVPDHPEELSARVTGLLPISAVSAVQNGSPVSVTQTSSSEYLLKPSSNGALDITVTLVNGQRTTGMYIVTGLDQISPMMLSYEVAGDTVVLTLSDADSGIHYDGIRVQSASGQSVALISCDRETGVIVLPRSTEALHVYVPDTAGNMLHILVTPQESQNN